MPIDSSKLKGDIAIELDGEGIPAADFVRALDAFLTIVKELTRQLHQQVPRDAWRLNVQEGSQIAALRADNVRLPQAIAQQVYAEFFDGMSVLEKEAKPPKLFTERALESARELSRIGFGKKDSGIPVRIFSKDRSHPVSRNVSNHVSEILDWKYEDLGTIEGTLEVVSAHNGYEFRVYEPMWFRPVRCLFDEKLLKEALQLFKQRVEVLGTIRYTKEGFPVSAQVSELRALEKQEELPSYKEVRGILGGVDDT